MSTSPSPVVNLSVTSNSPSENFEPQLHHLLMEPIVHLVMQADNVDEHEFRDLLERTTARIKGGREAMEVTKDPKSDQSMPLINGYRLGIGIMLLDSRGHIFVGQRVDVNEEAWQMPQGGIEQGETARDAALRELQEELGTSNATIIAETVPWFRYDLPAQFREGSRGRGWHGQQQRWFLMLFQGQDSEINVATKNPEFSRWRWVTTDALIELIAPFKRQLYLSVLREFSELT